MLRYSLLLMSSAISMNAAVNVNRIEPTDWYVGMKVNLIHILTTGTTRTEGIPGELGWINIYLDGIIYQRSYEDKIARIAS